MAQGLVWLIYSVCNEKASYCFVDVIKLICWTGLNNNLCNETRTNVKHVVCLRFKFIAQKWYGQYTVPSKSACVKI